MQSLSASPWLLAETEKPTPKFTESQGPQTAKTILRKKNEAEGLNFLISNFLRSCYTQNGAAGMKPDQSAHGKTGGPRDKACVYGHTVFHGDAKTHTEKGWALHSVGKANIHTQLNDAGLASRTGCKYSR